MNAIVRSAIPDTVARLIELGLTESILRQAISQGLLARSENTPNHPPLYAGFVTWANTVRALREELIPQHWTKNDEHMYSRVFNPSKTMAIAVATGDEHTGNPHVNPMTKSPKGIATAQAVESNAAQLTFGFELDQIDLENTDELKTWILMFTYFKNEVRCELSLPIACNGKVDGWNERIILRPIPLDANSIDIPILPLPEMPDIDVVISRRA